LALGVLKQEWGNGRGAQGLFLKVFLNHHVLYHGFLTVYLDAHWLMNHGTLFGTLFIAKVCVRALFWGMVERVERAMRCDDCTRNLNDNGQR
jgi:hypothetical protein